MRPVYSTDGGWLASCATCGNPPDKCRCRVRKNAPARPANQPLPNDGVVRIFRDRKRRGGKVVTVVTGVPAGERRDEVAGQLKRLCGAGGTVADDGSIEIQGDHRERVAAKLGALGFQVKLAGG